MHISAIILILLISSIANAQTPTSTETNTPVDTLTNTPTRTETPTRTITRTPSNTKTRTLTFTPTPTEIASRFQVYSQNLLDSVQCNSMVASHYPPPFSTCDACNNGGFVQAARNRDPFNSIQGKFYDSVVLLRFPVHIPASATITSARIQVANYNVDSTHNLNLNGEYISDWGSNPQPYYDVDSPSSAFSVNIVSTFGSLTTVNIPLTNPNSIIRDGILALKVTISGGMLSTTGVNTVNIAGCDARLQPISDLPRLIIDYSAPVPTFTATTIQAPTLTPTRTITRTASPTGTITPMTFTGFTVLTWAHTWVPGTVPFSNTGEILGGVAFNANGDVYSSQCQQRHSNMYKFNKDNTGIEHGSTIHIQDGSTPFQSFAGCGLVNHPNGHMYANTRDGIVELMADGSYIGTNGASGNILGIAIDPQDTDKLIYPGQGCASVPYGFSCDINRYSISNKTSEIVTLFPWSTVQFMDGVFFDPTGNYIFLAGRSPYHSVMILNRDGTLVQQVLMQSEPDGIIFHSNIEDFVLTNDIDGTMTRFDFPGNDYSLQPTQSLFHRDIGRGDLINVGVDGCAYAAFSGTRFLDGTLTPDQSILQICPGFAPPPLPHTPTPTRTPIDHQCVPPPTPTRPTRTPTNSPTPTATIGCHTNSNCPPSYVCLPTPTSPAGTPTRTPTITNTPTIANTPLNTNTPTRTPTNTQTNTPTFTITRTPSRTPTYTRTLTPTRTPTNTPLNTPTRTPSNTSTIPANTPTRTNTPVNTITNTPANTPTITPAPTAAVAGCLKLNPEFCVPIITTAPWTCTDATVDVDTSQALCDTYNSFAPGCCSYYNPDQVHGCNGSYFNTCAPPSTPTRTPTRTPTP